MIEIDRRRAFVSTAALTAGGLAATRFLPEESLLPDRRPARSRVAIVSAEDYTENLADTLLRALILFAPNVRSKSVLLKPNLVEYVPGADVNTHPLLVRAAAEAFLKLGARNVVVAEGPGHQRDTHLVLEESGLRAHLRAHNLPFTDLNRDELIRVPLRAHYTGLAHVWLPRSVMAADFVVSMPKIKTHHWAGVTLGMKNMFGTIPGAMYGWPKNILHWHGIHRSILDICATAPIHFVIADGIVAMEGNGPLHGTRRHLGKIVLADDPVAGDFTCVRLMGFDPYRIWHLNRAAKFLGNGSPERIELIAEELPREVVPFDVLPGFAHLAARS